MSGGGAEPTRSGQRGELQQMVVFRLGIRIAVAEGDDRIAAAAVGFIAKGQLLLVRRLRVVVQLILQAIVGRVVHLEGRNIWREVERERQRKNIIITKLGLNIVES